MGLSMQDIITSRVELVRERGGCLTPHYIRERKDREWRETQADPEPHDCRHQYSGVYIKMHRRAERILCIIR